jgi:hypothetical protein
MAEVHSVDFYGDYALLTGIMEGRVESHVYRRTDTGWERIHVLSTDDGGLDLSELEDAYREREQDVGFSPELAMRSSGGVLAVEDEASVVAMRESEIDSFCEGGTGWQHIQFASAGEGALDYLFEREGAEHAQDAGFAPRPAIRSSDDSSAVEYEMTGNELGLDSAGGAGWVRPQFASAGEGALDYLFGRERADHAQDAGFAPRPTVRSSEGIGAVEYEMTGNELGLGSAGGAGWVRPQFTPVGDAYWVYLFELETSETDR